MNKSSKDFIEGYDAAVSVVTGSCMLFDDDILSTPLPVAVLNDVRSTYCDERITTFADYVNNLFQDHFEMTRNEIITSFIDNMPDNLYEAIKNKVLAENTTKDEPKAYYDTRRFAITGKKE